MTAPGTATRTGECFAPAILTVFPVTPGALREILTGLNRETHEAHDIGEAVRFVSTRRAAVILSHCSFPGGTWKDILAHISTLPHAPRLIVTCEIADDFLWAEVLNLGGYDVIAQPFEGQEVARTLTSALRRWEEENGQGPPQTP